MDALPGDGDEEVLRNLKEGRRKESVNVDGDEWMYVVLLLLGSLLGLFLHVPTDVFVCQVRVGG